MFQSTNNLDFYSAESPYAIFDNHLMFRVGTCEGQWCSTEDCYVIISVTNSCPGNGHLQDVFEWFENSCKRDNKNLLVVECMNKRFYKHLISKRGFIPLDKDEDNCIKIFNKKAYKELLKNGNEILMKGSLKCK
jgi:hypothetical protein